jgi:[methyl-Co(III) methanol-specific corrinoid protein]:coenzyme M methyltransferase
MFEEYAVRYLNKLIDGIHSVGAPVIVHICGNMNMVKHLMPQIKSDAISTDALVNLRLLKEEFPFLTTMGNLSTFLLEFGTPDKVANQTERLVQDGIDIISPACGLSTSSSLANITAMTGAVKGSN